MEGTIVALVLLAMPALAIWAIGRALSRPAKYSPGRTWVALSFPALWVMLLWPVIFDSEGPSLPVTWYLAAPMSWAAIALFVGPGAVKRWALAGEIALTVLFIATMALAQGGYTTGPMDRRSSFMLHRVAEKLRSSSEADRAFAAGWVDEPPLDALWKPDAFLEEHGVRSPRSGSREWHTWLTGLYRVERRPSGIWFPGGRPAEAGRRLEWRVR